MIFNNELDNDGVQQVGNDPSLSSSSHNDNHDGDPEFEVTPEMLVHAGDNEGTLEEEEAFNDIDHDTEMEELQKEGELPIEELFAMYYGGGVEDPQKEHTVENIHGGAQEQRKGGLCEIKRKRSLEEMEPHKRMWGGPGAGVVEDDELKGGGELMRSEHMQMDINPSNNDYIGVNPSNNDYIGDRNEDDFDPFFNQRITRGLAALNSQFFDEEYSTDEEYQPSIDNWRKDVQIGVEHQAVVDEGTSHYDAGERDNDADKLLWRPDVVSAGQLETFLDIAYKLDDMNSQTTERDDEQVLYTLLQARDVDAALKRRQEQVRKGPNVSLWSEDECQNFEQGLRVFGKDFRLIQRNKVKSRTVGEIVQFYYLWKKTERHDAFVTQTKFGRKKYTLPGISDVMGRFMEENETIFPNRSLSPNFEQVRPNFEQVRHLGHENQGPNPPNGNTYLAGNEESSDKCDLNNQDINERDNNINERDNNRTSQNITYPIYEKEKESYLGSNHNSNYNQEGVENTGWSRTSLVPLV